MIDCPNRQPDIVTKCDTVESCEECSRYGDDCDGKFSACYDEENNETVYTPCERRQK